MRKYILIFLAILTFLTYCLAIKAKDNDCKSILFGIASSSFVVFIVESIAAIHERKRLAILGKTYERVKITRALDDRNPDGIYEDMTQRYLDAGINSIITLKYKGGGEYTGEAFYEQGKKTFTICLDRTNPKIGTGNYQYVEKKEGYEMPDLGTYTIQVDNNNADRLYVYYSNVIPNGLAKGYEIWEKSSLKAK